jgi:hypothetical protein
MPALPPKVTFAVTVRMSALCQKRTFRYSFDYLIGADVQRRYTAWNHKAAPRERRGYQFCRNYPIAFLTRSSVNGAWRKRLPVRAMIAFDTAGVISGVAI